MIDSKKVLGLILARSGSKGLINKNIKTLIDKPLIAWTVESAIESKYIDDVVISSDSEEIIEIGKNYGAIAPFIRPSELATDEAKSSDCIIHAINYLEKENKKYDYFLLLEPTSPLREVSDIDKSIELLNKKKQGAIVSVCLAEGSHPAFLYRIDANNYINPITGKHPSNLRRQDIEELFFVEGTIYCSTVSDFKKERTFYHAKTCPYYVPKWKSIEVDDIYDFVMIESIIKYRRKNK